MYMYLRVTLEYRPCFVVANIINTIFFAYFFIFKNLVSTGILVYSYTSIRCIKLETTIFIKLFKY